MTGGSARVAIAEPWSVLRRGLIGLLIGRHTVVADVEDVAALVQLAVQRPLDLVVVGEDAASDLHRDIEQLHAIAPRLPIVVLCDDIDTTRLQAVLRAGAQAVLSKKVADDALLESIDRVLGGDRVVDQRFLPLLFGHDDLTAGASEGTRSLLTRREMDVLVQLAKGFTNRQIADALVVGEATVKTHLARIYTKLEVDDRHHAVGRALELGLLR